MSGTPAPQLGEKCQHHPSNQGVPAPRQDKEEVADLDSIPKECPHKKRKDRRPVGKALKEPWSEAFSKELAMVKAARQAYHNAHCTNFKQEGLYNLSSMF